MGEVREMAPGKERGGNKKDKRERRRLEKEGGEIENSQGDGDER